MAGFVLIDTPPDKAYPEFARLLKDVDKSSPATPGGIGGTNTGSWLSLALLVPWLTVWGGLELGCRC